MGNCQAAEASTVVIEHPGNKFERIYYSVSARRVMNSNPGYYVALVITSTNHLTLKSENGTPLTQLKLLRPRDILLIGHVYRLISFQEVLKEFAAKKCVKLGKLLKETGCLVVQTKHGLNPSTLKVEQELCRMGTDCGSSNNNNSNIKGGRRQKCGGEWRPALHCISESGS